MAHSAKLIERMIPDSLRLADHPDAAIVNAAVATVITAINESDAMTLSGASKDVHAALQRYYESVYVPHIAKEDEDWNGLKSQVESHKATIERLKTEVEPETVYYKFRGGRPRPSMGTLATQRDGSGGIVTFMDGKGASGDGIYESNKDYVAAIDDAIRKAGYTPFMVGSYEGEQ